MMSCSYNSIGGVPISLYEAIESATRGSCDANLRLLSQSNSTSTASWLILISLPAEGRRLSWPEWLVTYRDGIPANGHPSQY